MKDSKEKKSLNLSVEVIFDGPGRLVEQHSETIGPMHRKTWRDAGSLASPRTYQNNGLDITVAMDWSVVARRFIKYTELVGENRGESEHYRWLEKSNNAVKIPTKIRVEGQGEWEDNPIDPRFFVLYHISNVFLAMNIAAPGCANFAGMVVKGAMYDQAVGLSSYDYDFAWSQSINGKWPGLKSLPLKQCFDWLAPLEKRVVQVANSPLERISLSMMHIARLDSSPSSIVWIWSALEAIFHTSVGQGFGQLQTRLCRLLSADPRQEKYLKRRLRSIYNLRNAFVHGGSAVVHPHFNERIDPLVDQKMSDYVDAHCEGVQILLACVQELVDRGWSGVQFQEEMAGID